MLLLSTAFMVVGYCLLFAGIRGGPNQKYARAPWTLLVDAAKHVPNAAGQTARSFGVGVVPGVGPVPQVPGAPGPTSTVGVISGAVPLPAAYAALPAPAVPPA